MKIGVVCDTHNNIKNVRRIIELFNEAQVDRVVHTGDITKASTLTLFEALNSPLYGVFGNNDLERDELEDCIENHSFLFQDPPLKLCWSDREILVVHDPMELPESHQSSFDLVLHGHTHLKRIERTERGLIFNPGECAGHMVGLNAVGIVELASMNADLLHF